MGYDVTRFTGEVDEDLLCPICCGVLEEPVQITQCEHAFCNTCITQWFCQKDICPVDRTFMTLTGLGPVPRIVKNMLNKLQINCDNASFGCTATLRLDQLQSHLKDCEHNPKRPVTCEEGCGFEMLNKEILELEKRMEKRKAGHSADEDALKGLQGLPGGDYNEILVKVGTL